MTMSTPPSVRPQQPGPQRRRRSRVRTILPLAVAAWAVLEIWLLIMVAGATSGLTVFLLIVAGLILGASAVKRAGRSAWRNLTAQVQAAQAQAARDPNAAPTPPAASKGRNGLAMLGGLLLIIPGFISDAVALFLLFPPTRRLIGKGVDRLNARALAARTAAAEPGSVGDLFQQARDANEQIRIHKPDGKVIQGEVVDHRD
ncbi:FxsA family membrane protein [Streptomyces sp. NPDC008139]|uniref:FxsA family membrane protein n=1 Tax=Streptomyces sp. NPDC008139 TaxID=3364814 RepID=UPI0036EA048D